MIVPRPIETAPKDGTPIFAYDGTWWRDYVRWRGERDGRPAGWYFQGWLPVAAIQWYPRDADYEALQALVADGYGPVARNGGRYGG